MNIMIVTHNKYLELGLKKLLSRHSITIGADFFIPDNREHIINNNIFVILCDKKNSMLMNYIFNGYRFYGFAPIFPDTCYHLTHYWPAAADIPV
ncbi:hypothetical protein OFO05_19070, partial [Escherichia coli]|nr:hypothetical protein [Escherichia coli]